MLRALLARPGQAVAKERWSRPCSPAKTCSPMRSRWWPTGCASGSHRHRRAAGDAARPGLSAEGVHRVNRPEILRSQLLIGILMPLLIGFGINTTSLYRQALRAADTAYDRTLLASAKSIGEQLGSKGPAMRAPAATVPYSALRGLRGRHRSRCFQGERFPRRDGDGLRGLAGGAGCRSRAVCRAGGLLRRHLPRPAGARGGAAAAGGQPRRGRGMTTIQVAETLELRQTLARQILVDTLWRQGGAAAGAGGGGAVGGAARHAPGALAERPAARARRERPRAHRRARCAARAAAAAGRAQPGDGAPPTCSSTRSASCATARTSCARRWRCSRRRCSRRCAATSSSRRRPCRRCATPSSAPRSSPTRCSRWPGRAVAPGGDAPVVDWAEIVRARWRWTSARSLPSASSTSRSPPCRRRCAHEWALRELTRNLLHNAIRHCREGGTLAMRLVSDGRTAALTIADSGPGLAPPNCASTCSSLRGRRAWRRLGPGPGDLRRDRAHALRQHRAGRPRQRRASRGARCHGARAAGGQSAAMSDDDTPPACAWTSGCGRRASTRRARWPPRNRQGPRRGQRPGGKASARCEGDVIAIRHAQQPRTVTVRA